MSRVLCIGDLHEPFCLNGYLEFCVDTYNKWDCDNTIFIGDIVDNHYVSYHETETCGMGGDDELDKAICNVSRWHDTFPEAMVTIGNHDRLPGRKAQSGGIPTRWIRAYEDVLETPTWKFVTEIEIDGVTYIHGEGGTARTRCVKDMRSLVQGHLHSQCYTHWHVGARDRIFGMQVGCGVDKESYALAYAKNFPKQAIACGVIIDGETAVNEMMPL